MLECQVDNKDYKGNQVGVVHIWFNIISDDFQKQPSRSVLSKRRSENMQQIYRRRPMPKCDFNKVQSNLLHVFRTPSTKNTSEELLLKFVVMYCQLLPILFKKTTWFKQSSSPINISPNRQHGSNQAVHISIFVLRSLVSQLLLNLKVAMDNFLGILIFWELKLSCNMNKKARIWVIFEKPGKYFNWARVEGPEKFDTV